jgi:hypothetical protein
MGQLDSGGQCCLRTKCHKTTYETRKIVEGIEEECESHGEWIIYGLTDLRPRCKLELFPLPNKRAELNRESQWLAHPLMSVTIINRIHG